MVDIPIRIKIKESGADEATDAIDDLAGAGGGGGVGGLGEAFAGLTGGGGGGALAAAGPVGAAAVAIGGAFVAALGAAKLAIDVAIPAIIDFGNELERQAGIFNRTEGSVDEASAAIGGLVSNIDLMLARNRLMQAGIHLSNRDFAAVAEVATDFAAATGEDATGAMGRLGNALRTLSSEGLGEFGIRLDTTKTRSEQLEDALRQLRQRSDEMETGADTLGGSIQELSTFIDNVKTNMFQMINSSTGIRQEFEGLWDAVRRLAQTFGVDLREPMELVMRGFAVLLGFMQEMIRRVRLLTSAWANFRTAIQNADLGAAADGMRDLGQASTSWVMDFVNSIRNANTIMSEFRENARGASSDVETGISGGTPGRRGGGAINLANLSLERLLVLQERAVNNQNIRLLDRVGEELARRYHETAEQAEIINFQMDQVGESTREATELAAEMYRQNRIQEQALATQRREREADERALANLEEAFRVQALEGRARSLQIQIQDNVAAQEAAQTQIGAEERLLELEQERLTLSRELLQIANEIGESRMGSWYTEQQIVQTVRELADAAQAARRQFIGAERFAEGMLDTMEDGLNSTNALWTQAFTLIAEGGENMEEQFVRILDAWLTQFAIQEGFEAAKEFVMAIAAAARQDYASAGQHAAAGAGHAALAAAAGGAAAAIPNPGAGGGGAAGNNRDENRDAGAREPGQVIININGQALLTQAQVGREVRRALEAEQRRF